MVANFTNENSSPSRILTSTICRRTESSPPRNKGLVYAIAPSRRRRAVLAAGTIPETPNMPRYSYESVLKNCRIRQDHSPYR